jgi:hypothetical protein
LSLTAESRGKQFRDERGHVMNIMTHNFGRLNSEEMNAILAEHKKVVEEGVNKVMSNLRKAMDADPDLARRIVEGDLP